MVAQHIHYAHLRNAHLKQVGTLCHAGTNEQSAVAAAHDGDVVLAREAVGNKPFGSRNKVVEHVLLLHLRACNVPFLAVFASATKVYLHVDATILKEWYAHRREIGGQRDVKATVSVD